MTNKLYFFHGFYFDFQAEKKVRWTPYKSAQERSNFDKKILG